MAETQASAVAAVSVKRATSITAALVALSTVLGFSRDLLIAHQFGAGSGSDAFLVAWTVPETASPLLIEDAMALLMVPAFSRAIVEHGGISRTVARTLPWMLVSLSALTAICVIAAPMLVMALAPGLEDAALAVRCTRLTSLTLLTFAVTGYMSAALRAQHRFSRPAGIYAAYNTGIITAVILGSSSLGVASAAVGVAIGSVFMVAIQAPEFVRSLRAPVITDSAGPPVLAAIIPITVYTALRQGQVFVERFFGSYIAAGSISHLNYAQKVAQVPMVFSLLVVTVTFPRLARACAAGDRRQMRYRIMADLVLASSLIMPAMGYLVTFAPDIIALLFQHGRFTALDTADTAGIMRIYALGLFGQVLVGVLARAFFADVGWAWYPASVMGAGLALNIVVAGLGVDQYKVAALATANTVGITVAAAGMLIGMRRREVALKLSSLCNEFVLLGLAAAASALVGGLIGDLLRGSVPLAALLMVCGVVVAAVYIPLVVTLGVGRRCGSPTIFGLFTSAEGTR